VSRAAPLACHVLLLCVSRAAARACHALLLLCVTCCCSCASRAAACACHVLLLLRVTRCCSCVSRAAALMLAYLVSVYIFNVYDRSFVNSLFLKVPDILRVYVHILIIFI